MEHMQTSLEEYYHEIYRLRGATEVLPIPEPVLGRIASSVATGLRYLLDEHNILHRDVKPANILTNWRGEVKLCDFNISRAVGDTTSTTMSMSFSGTYAYAAPEVYQHRLYDEKSDVWSVGVTILELAIGRLPFEAKTQFNLMNEIVNRPAPQLPEGRYSQECRQFLQDWFVYCNVGKCSKLTLSSPKSLQKQLLDRVTFDELLKMPFARKNRNYDISGFSNSILDSLNNKLYVED